MFTQTMTFREKILGLGTAVILVLAGLSFGLSQVKQWRSSVSSRAMAIGLEEAEAETLLAEKELWDERAIYLDAELPDFPGRGEAASTLLSSLSDSAKTAGPGGDQSAGGRTRSVAVLPEQHPARFA